MADDAFGPRPAADPIATGSFASPISTDDLHGRIQNWDRLLDAHWSGWRQEAKENFDFVAGRQWTTDEVKQMEDLNRIPVVFNRIAPTIDAVSGAEISSRQQVQYFPRQVGDTEVDDILTQGAEWIMDECEGNEEDSDAFKDCLICGVGCTETRPDYDKDSRITKERIDPLEMTFDPSSRKPCFADARYLRRKKPMSREEFNELWPGYGPEGSTDLDERKPVIVDPRIRYDGTNEDDTVSKDEVIVREYQWFDREDRWLVGGQTGRMILSQYPNVSTRDNFVELTEEQHAQLQETYPGTKTVKIKVKVFKRCFVAGNSVMEANLIEAEDFTYKAMTGKRDRNKNWWYGLARPMIDPQKWSNKLFSQLLHIMRTNAQGGMMAEEDFPLDVRKFEESWADPSAITYVKKGSLSLTQNPKYVIKPTAVYPQGMDRLMEVSQQAIKDTTGVNDEMLGSADRDQPGVLEMQRKQQAFGILNAFFDAKRRYHKMQGRLLLKMIALYMPQDKLVRITQTQGDQMGPKYVQLAMSKDAMEYDVVVDEAPAGPNQKQAVFQILIQLMPLLQNAGLGANVWAEIARYSPLPAKVSELIASDLMQKQQQEQQTAPVQQQLQMQGAQAKISDLNASADHHAAQAQLLKAKAVETHAGVLRDVLPDPVAPDPEMALKEQESAATVALDRAKTGKIMAEIVKTMTEPPKETR